MTDLSEYLKDWRKRADLSQPKAAAALNLPLPTLRHIEQGRNFKYEQMLRLAIFALEIGARREEITNG